MLWVGRVEISPGETQGTWRELLRWKVGSVRGVVFRWIFGSLGRGVRRVGGRRRHDDTRVLGWNGGVWKIEVTGGKEVRRLGDGE